MSRSRIEPYVPQWGGAIEGYSHRWVHKQGWRVQDVVGGHNDQMQECAIVFSKLRNRYGGTLDNPREGFVGRHDPRKHFMALFKIGLCNHWVYLTRRIEKTMGCVANMKVADKVDPDALLTTYPEAEIVCDLKSASAELIAVIQMIVNSPSEVLSALWDENPLLQERSLCRAAGVRHKPVFAEIRAMVTGETHR